MGKVLKGGTIVTSKETYIADIRIEHEKIVDIGTNIEITGDEIISVKGCYLVPGGIDAHTHFDLDVGTTVTADNFQSGTKAAIVGGTTTIIDFVNHVRGNTLKQSLEEYKNKTYNKCFCDYGFHMSISEWNENIEKEMEYMVKEEGISSFKMYMAYENLKVSDGSLYNAIKKSKELNALIGVHCENGDLIDERIKEFKSQGKLSPFYHGEVRPPMVEKEAIGRLLSIGQLIDYPVWVVHLSSKLGLDEIEFQRKQGAKVIVETCPQYLVLDKSLYGKKEDKNFQGAKYVISPPLREKENNLVLWNGLSQGNIDIVSTDHCSFNYKGQKDLGINDFSKIPNGGPGVEHRMLLLYNLGVLENKITLNKFVEITSTNPAKIFGMYPKKGELQVGSDADIVVLNENKPFKISYKNQVQNVDYTPYEGIQCKGSIEYVFLRGDKVVINGNVLDNKHRGNYIRRNKSSYGVK